MKNIVILLLLLSALAVQKSQAQLFTFNPTVTNPTSGIVNTTPDTMTLTVNPFIVVSIQPVITKVSGTVGGVVYLYGGLYSNSQMYLTDSLTLTNVASQSVIWNLTNPNYRFYTIYFNGTGTMSATATARLSGRL